MQAKIDKLKSEYQIALDKYSKIVREYVQEYGIDNSDYLIHRRLMEQYYRGKYNALCELEEM